MLELKETKHNNYCVEYNYYAKDTSLSEYDDFNSFMEDWCLSDGLIDCNKNLCFRYDIIKKKENETDNQLDEFELWLFFILQRKGIFTPVLIKTLKQEDIPYLEKVLSSQWEYMKEQWIEFIK